MLREHLKNNILLLFDSNKVEERFSLCVGFYPSALAEPLEKAGLYHLMEHMLFKTDEFNDQHQKVKNMEWNGIDIGASTSYGVVKLTCSGPNENICEGLKLIHAMWAGSKYNQDDFEKEKNVVLEELRMYQNNPSDYVDEWVMAPQLFSGTPLSTSLLGTPQTLNNISINDLQSVKSSSHAIISICGNLSEEQRDEIKKQCEETFCQITPTTNTPSFPTYQPNFGMFTQTKKSIDQSYVQRGFIVPSARDEEHLNMLLLSYILDGGMSSRVFQCLREKHALGYAVGARYDENYGYLTMFVHGCDEQQVIQCQQAFTDIVSELSDIAENEFKGMKTLLRSHLLERLTCQETIASDHVDSIIYKHKLSNNEIHNRLDKCTVSDLKEIIELLQHAKYVDAVLNPEQES